MLTIHHQVYKAVPELARDEGSSSPVDGRDTDMETDMELLQTRSYLSRRCILYLKNAAAPWRDYVASPVFLASFALSLLYLTVLSFGAQMVTYLLHIGFTSFEVSCMRIGAVVSELAGTWAAPLAMNRVGPIRSGLWFINWQFGCLAAGAAAFAFLEPGSKFVAISLIVGVALSRLGLWGFDLSVQFLVQEVSLRQHHGFKLSSLNCNSLFLPRTQTSTPERASLRPRWRFRTSSSFCPLPPRSCSLSRSNSNIPSSSAMALLRLPRSALRSM